MFILVYSNQDANVKIFKTRRYYLPKGIIKNYNVIINGKNFFDQPIYSDIKQIEEIRKLRDKVKIIPQDVCWIMNSSKIIID